MDLSTSEVAGIVALTLVVGLVAGVMVAENTTEVTLPKVDSSDDGTISRAETSLVAVDRQGRGLTTPLSVRTVPGDGRVLVDIESLLFFLDTQQSIQTAREVAENSLNLTLRNRDVVYDIRINNTTVVGGQSAGGPLTVATVAALQGKHLRNDTIMTGTIKPDGSIGKVGGILAKGRAAKEAGYSTFLVPEGQGTYTRVEKVEECHPENGLTVCDTDFVRREISIGEEIGIKVREVSNINQVTDLMVVK